MESGHPYDAVPTTAIIPQAPAIDLNALGYGERNSRGREAPSSTSRAVSGARMGIGACRPTSPCSSRSTGVDARQVGREAFVDCW